MLQLFHLAQAREILLLEGSRLMPKGATKQREDTLAVIDMLLMRYLAHAKSALPAPGDDDITRNAHFYLLSLTEAAPPPVRTFASPYATLHATFDELEKLGLAAQILDWLQSTHALPDLDVDILADAKAALGIFKQRLLLEPSIREAIEAIRTPQDDLSEEDARNARLMVQQWMEQAGLSEEFVAQMSHVHHASFLCWEEAKPASDFARWLPHLVKVIDCARRKAEILASALNVSPYQAMLEQFNPGLKNETVNAMFTPLGKILPDLLTRVTAHQKKVAAPIAVPVVATVDQRRILKRIVDAMGFEPDVSRMDESMHPFSTGEWDDVRVTVHYHENNLLSAVMASVHEMGHLLYSRHLPRDWKYQPIGDAQSMWIHESQSLFWEKQVGGSPEFMRFVSGIIREELKSQDPVWQPENLHALVARVEPGFIRIEADEVTYPAHIILRHGIEQDLIAGRLLPKDLPHVWNKRMRELLGIEVPDDAHGCLQDVHWTDGSFGYFPAYSFGAIAAAQFMEKARESLPDIDNLMLLGQLAPIRVWLTENIHEMGSRLDGEALVEHVTGKPLSLEPWLAHIERRYLSS